MTTKMKSIQISLKSLSIYFVLTSMLIVSVYCDYKREFLSYYLSNENKFLATFSLSKLERVDRENICKALGRENNYETDNEILLVNITVIDVKFIEVPAFQCASIETSFYVAFMPPHQYFKLNRLSSNSRPSYIIEVKMTSAKNISSYADNQDDILEEIYRYFGSAEYAEAAQRAIGPYSSSDTWKDLCRMFNVNLYLYRNENFQAHDTHSFTFGMRNITKGNIPGVTCPTVDENRYLVVYFTGGIFFMTHHYTDLRNLFSVKFVRPDAENDVDLTVSPYYQQFVPKDIVDIIAIRRRQ